MRARRRPTVSDAVCGLLSVALSAWAAAAGAGEADVVAAKAYPEGGDKWRFEVTVRHADTGWDHYADKWEVLGPGGTPLGTRVLLHPHENEQPFTRSLGGVAVPGDVEAVTIRAHDSQHGSGGKEFRVPLKR